ncbi:uncharacterized protein LOC110453791 isoform X2 [Mizuhopecten yessoensis]|nr:uncharacterized protein LOC110453791 isoform X2 [Mizuhopecten yessoensis]XP_021358627.1 uncharacterized protein LOC110453791 isoform X2 [Mizuhopecten yessoensis]
MSDKLEYINHTILECHRDEVSAYLWEHGFVKTVWFLVEKVWDNITISEADRVLKARDESSPLYRLLFKEYNVEEHFRQVDSHREWIVKAYERLKDYVPHMTIEDAKLHDLSKYDFVQAIGYTAKWVHDVDWGNETWQASLNDHYRRERHHPQFYPKGQRMPRKDLEESLVDMVASRWERQLEGNDQASNVELVEFDSKYLLRYCKEDIADVQALIGKIKQGDITEYRWKLIASVTPESKREDVQVFFKENGFVQTICHLYETVWDPDSIALAEKGLKDRDPDSPFYQLLYIEYDVQEHYRQCDSHRFWIMKAYERLKSNNFLTEMTDEEAKVHDLSKYDISQSIGYTAMWVHKVDWNNKTWQTALNDHYRRESHHPQFHPKDKRMPRKDLEESLVDMIACRWERDLKGDEKTTWQDLVDFHPNYLKRYCEEDLTDVTSLITSIKGHPEN